MRGIAREAGVDPALVRHYFSTKTELFVEAMRPPIELSTQIAELAKGDPSHVGERVMNFFVRSWEHPVVGPRVIALMRAALEQPHVAAYLRMHLVEGVMQNVALAAGAGNPARAAITASSQIFGLAMLRYVAQMEPLASEPPDELTARYAPILTRLLTDPAA